MTDSETADIASIGQSADVAELSDRLRHVLVRCGFDRFEYYWFAPRSAGDRVYSVGAQPDGEEMVRLCLHPLVHHCRLAYTPVVWQSLSPDASIRQLLVWSPWQRLPRMTNGGIAIPLHGPDSDFGLLSATVASQADTAPPADHVHWVHAAALAAHDRIVANCDNAPFGLHCVVIDSQRLTCCLGDVVQGARAVLGSRH